MTTEPRWLDRRQAAKATGLGVDKIKAAIDSGSLRAKRSGAKVLDDGTKVGTGKYLIRAVDLDAWFDTLEDA